MKFAKLGLILIVIIFVGAVALSQGNSLIPSAALAFNETMISENLLVDASRELAQTYGLEHINSESWYLMTLGSYLTLTNQEEGVFTSYSLNRSSPIFVYQVKGSIPQINLPGLANENYKAYSMDSITIIADAVHGELLSTQTTPVNVPAPDFSTIPVDNRSVRATVIVPTLMIPNDADSED